MSNICTLCCCFRAKEREVFSEQPNERQPLLQGPPQSARQSRPAYTDTKDLPLRSGPFIARHVGIPELDRRFEDVAEMFNLQQGHHEAMAECFNTLRSSYHCLHDDGLSECLRKIKEEHGSHHNITLVMKGYDFSLAVLPKDVETPTRLQKSQDSVRGLSVAAKAIVAAGTKLQEMIGWLTQAEAQLLGRVQVVASAFQEQRRLEDNLRENLQECRRASELSSQYREEAGKLLNEAALLSGVNP